MIKKLGELFAAMVSTKTRRRFVFGILGLIIGSFILAQCVSCGWEKGEFFFKWMPAAEIKVDVKR